MPSKRGKRQQDTMATMMDPMLTPHLVQNPPPSWPQGPRPLSPGRVLPQFFVGHPGQHPGRRNPEYYPGYLVGQRPGQHSGNQPYPFSRHSHYTGPSHPPHASHAPVAPETSGPHMNHPLPQPHSSHGPPFSLDLLEPPPLGHRRPRPFSGNHPGQRSHREVDPRYHTEPHHGHGPTHAPSMQRISDPAPSEYSLEDATAPPQENLSSMEHFYPGALRAVTPPLSVYSVGHAPRPHVAPQNFHALTRGQGLATYPPLSRAATEVSYRRPTATYAAPERRHGPAPSTVGLPAPESVKPKRRYSASAYPYADDTISVYSAPGYSKRYIREAEEYYANPQSEYGGDLYSLPATSRYRPRGMSYTDETYAPRSKTRGAKTAPAFAESYAGPHAPPPPLTYTPPEDTASSCTQPPGIIAPLAMNGGYARPHARHAPPKHANPQVPMARGRPRHNSGRSFPALCTLPRAPSPGVSSLDDWSEVESENVLGMPTRPASPANGPSRRDILWELERHYQGREPNKPLRPRSRSCDSSKGRSRYRSSGSSRSFSRPRFLHPSGAASSYDDTSRSHSRFHSDPSRSASRLTSAAPSSYEDRSRSQSRYRSPATSRSPSRGRSGYNLHERSKSRHTSSHAKSLGSSRHVSRHGSRHTSRRPGRRSLPGQWDDSDSESAIDTGSGSSEDEDEDEAISDSDEPKYQGFVFEGVEEIESTISGHGNSRGKGLIAPVPHFEDEEEDGGHEDYGRGHDYDYDDRDQYQRPNRSSKKASETKASKAKTKSRAPSRKKR